MKVINENEKELLKLIHTNNRELRKVCDQFKNLVQECSSIKQQMNQVFEIQWYNINTLRDICDNQEQDYK